MIYDVIIVGGGPAGLNAAVVLGRCKRKVLLFDSGKYRNARSSGMHNYLTRDGVLPREFLELARHEVLSVGVTIRQEEIMGIIKTSDNLFQATGQNDETFIARKLLLATGLRDQLPDLPDIDSYYGTSVHHCPYCDGWEERDKKLVLYSKHVNGFGMALALRTWSDHITLVTDGGRYLSAKQKSSLNHYKIQTITTPVRSLQGSDGRLKSITFRNGQILECDTMFFSDNYQQQYAFIKDIHCTLNSKGVVRTNSRQETNVEGVYVAGDASRDMHMVVVAAAEGAKAGVVINKALQLEQNPLYPA